MDQQINDKAVKFRAFAEKRVSKVIKTLRQIANLSRRTSYDYRPEQVEKMFGAIRAEVDATEAKFAPPKPKEQGALFVLD